MPYINVDEAYILDNTGLQVDQVVDIPYTDAALTDGQKEQARKNIGAGGTNPNLLDNPFFSVNQRSAMTITGSSSGVFSVDRWRLFGTTTSLTVTSTGVSVCSKSNGLLQRFDADLGTFLNGKAVTLSVMDDSGNIASGSLVYDNTALKNTGSLTIGSYTVVLYAGVISGYQAFSILTGDDTINLRAVKLELGAFSTLANDAPPDYGTELAKCQRYFVRALGDPFGTGYITTAGNNSRITVPVPMTMRATPTVSFSGTFHLRVQGTTLNVTTMSAVSPKNTAGGITLSCSGFSGATTGFCALHADGLSDYIDFSADL